MRVLGSSAAWRYIATNSGAMRQYPGRQTYNNRSAENLHTVMQNHAHASILTSCVDNMAFLILETMKNCFYSSVLTHTPYLPVKAYCRFTCSLCYKPCPVEWKSCEARYIFTLPSPFVGGAVVLWLLL